MAGRSPKLRELYELSPEERRRKLEELRDELMHVRAMGAMGGAPPNPGKIKALRIAIARLLTIIRREETK